MPRESGHYPPGAEFDPNAPWNQTDDESEPEWFFFEQVVHVAVKATSAADAEAQIDALFDNPNLEIEYKPEATKE